MCFTLRAEYNFFEPCIHWASLQPRQFLGKFFTTKNGAQKHYNSLTFNGSSRKNLDVI